MDGRPNRRNKAAFSNFSGVVRVEEALTSRSTQVHVFGVSSEICCIDDH